jgi:hypothetical protein
MKKAATVYLVAAFSLNKIVLTQYLYKFCLTDFFEIVGVNRCGVHVPHFAGF